MDNYANNTLGNDQLKPFCNNEGNPVYVRTGTFDPVLLRKDDETLFPTKGTLRSFKIDFNGIDFRINYTQEAHKGDKIIAFKIHT